MDVPEKAIDNRKLTVKERERLLDELDYWDRQNTIEDIYDWAVDVKETDSPAKMYEALSQIRLLCGDFL